MSVKYMLNSWVDVAKRTSCVITDLTGMRDAAEEAGDVPGGVRGLLSYLERQRDLAPEVSTVLSWVARGEMALNTAFDLVEVVSQRRKLSSIVDPNPMNLHHNQGYILGYAGEEVDAAVALFQILSATGFADIGVYEQQGRLYEPYATEGVRLPGFYRPQETVKYNHLTSLNESEYPVLLLADWDESPESFETIKNLSKRRHGYHVLANVTKVGFFNRFETAMHDLDAYWLYRDNRGMIELGQSKLVHLQKRVFQY